jgi:hypothetical protein
MNGTFDCLALIFHFLFVMFAAFGQRSIRPGTFGGEFRLGLGYELISASFTKSFACYQKKNHALKGCDEQMVGC